MLALHSFPVLRLYYLDHDLDLDHDPDHDPDHDLDLDLDPSNPTLNIVAFIFVLFIDL